MRYLLFGFFLPLALGNVCREEILQNCTTEWSEWSSCGTVTDAKEVKNFLLQEKCEIPYIYWAATLESKMMQTTNQPSPKRRKREAQSEAYEEVLASHCKQALGLGLVSMPQDFYDIIDGFSWAKQIKSAQKDDTMLEKVQEQTSELQKKKKEAIAKMENALGTLLRNNNTTDQNTSYASVVVMGETLEKNEKITKKDAPLSPAEQEALREILLQWKNASLLVVSLGMDLSIEMLADDSYNKEMMNRIAAGLDPMPERVRILMKRIEDLSDESKELMREAAELKPSVFAIQDMNGPGQCPAPAPMAESCAILHRLLQESSEPPEAPTVNSFTPSEAGEEETETYVRTNETTEGTMSSVETLNGTSDIVRATKWPLTGDVKVPLNAKNITMSNFTPIYSKAGEEQTKTYVRTTTNEPKESEMTSVETPGTSMGLKSDKVVTKWTGDVKIPLNAETKTSSTRSGLCGFCLRRIRCCKDPYLSWLDQLTESEPCEELSTPCAVPLLNDGTCDYHLHIPKFSHNAADLQALARKWLQISGSPAPELNCLAVDGVCHCCCGSYLVEQMSGGGLVCRKK